MRNLLFALFLSTAAASFAQSIAIPAQTFNAPVTINGTTIELSITVPAQTVALPAETGSLPSGMSYTPSGGLVVSGPISATQVSLTGGSALPICTSGLYLLQYTAATNTLTPACFVAAALPAITVSQAASGAITLIP